MFRRWQVAAISVIAQADDWYHDCISDVPLLTRMVSHLGLLGLVLLVVLVSQVRLDTIKSPSDIPNSSPTLVPIDLPEPLPDNSGGIPPPLTFPSIPKRTRKEITQYVVQPSDTVTGIAEQFGLNPDSILYANPKLQDNPDFLSLGQVLNIPPMDGVLYTVRAGDTVQKIADRYKGKQTVEAIVQAIVTLEFNQGRHDLNPPNYALSVGEFLMVPNGTQPAVARITTSKNNPALARARATRQFNWPVTGRITQRFWAHHPGIDIAAPMGTPIRASDAGTIVLAGWDTTGYGNMILVSHGNGYFTRYAHLSTMDVRVGDVVQKGQQIGRVGSTGRSTGPHLHFEIISHGVHVDPFTLLP